MPTLNLGKKGVALAVVGIGFLLITTSALAKADNNSKLGWGFGDRNHVHVGPSGQSVSVRPESGEDRGDKEKGEIEQSNHVANNFSFNLTSVTGGNNANNSKGGVSIVTGAVTYVFNFVSSLGQNINIFGS